MQCLTNLLLGLVFIGYLVGCKSLDRNTSDTKAFDSSFSNDVHIVVAARPSSSNQKLFVCQGQSAAPGMSESGYPVSIGDGLSGKGRIDNLTPEQRNKYGSNLTPVGRFEIREKIGPTKAIDGSERCDTSTAGAFKGMMSRCIGLRGIEPGINENTQFRDIFIHGTPRGNYQWLGMTASHGCIRMKNNDVAKVFDSVKTGDKLYISNLSANTASEACQFSGNPGRDESRKPQTIARAPLCRSADLSVFKIPGYKFQIKSGHNLQFVTTAKVPRSVREDSKHFAYLDLVTEDAVTQSNQLAGTLGVSGYDNGQIGGTWKMDIDPRPFNFNAKWQCDHWYGAIGDPGSEVPIMIIP